MDADIQGFIDAMPEMRAIADRHDDEMQEYKRAFMRDRKQKVREPFGNALKSIKGKAIYGEVDAAAREHGFDGAPDWAHKGDRIVNAYVSLEMANRAPQMQQHLAAARQMIESNPNFTAEQRKNMLAQLDQGAGMMEGWNASEADKAIVARRRNDLEAAFNKTASKSKIGVKQ